MKHFNCQIFTKFLSEMLIETRKCEVTFQSYQSSSGSDSENFICLKLIHIKFDMCYLPFTVYFKS